MGLCLPVAGDAPVVEGRRVAFGDALIATLPSTQGLKSCCDRTPRFRRRATLPGLVLRFVLVHGVLGPDADMLLYLATVYTSVADCCPPCPLVFRAA